MIYCRGNDVSAVKTRKYVSGVRSGGREFLAESAAKAFIVAKQTAL